MMILCLSDYYFAIAVILLILSTSASKGETKRLYIANKKLSFSHTIKPLHFSIRELEIMQSRVILLLLLAMHILFEIIFLLYV